MAPHLTATELDFTFDLEKKGMTGVAIHKALTRKRGRCGLATPTLHRFRKVLRGVTYRRSRKETRGRKRKLTRKAVLQMNKVRRRLIKKVDKQREVIWEDVRKASRAPRVHRTTLLRSFKCEGLKVQARPPRAAPS